MRAQNVFECFSALKFSYFICYSRKHSPFHTHSYTNYILLVKNTTYFKTVFTMGVFLYMQTLNTLEKAQSNVCTNEALPIVKSIFIHRFAIHVWACIENAHFHMRCDFSKAHLVAYSLWALCDEHCAFETTCRLALIGIIVAALLMFSFNCEYQLTSFSISYTLYST